MPVWMMLVSALWPASVFLAMAIVHIMEQWEV